MCEQCHCSLLGKSPSQPSDALANFQYYACSELPVEIRDTFRSASPFEIGACLSGMRVHHHTSLSGTNGAHVPS
ncbi:hypothetical protein M404DRAFT_148626 [Pisolithus tinctorius Marx 270]|uniref:Uncharacterized protein n=1 Tax=Pisolithus tinctorius Marx 270 TaxID=870435 RepID=A0A0C3NM65_PISTI|nr:hypothetical protein M404DRAFT_148626 [Pisolithus tinctorius Marx 270]